MATPANNTPEGVVDNLCPQVGDKRGKLARKVHPFGLHIAPCEAVTLPLSGLQLVAARPGSFLFGGRAHA